MPELSKLINVHKSIAESDPSLKRGRVYCRHCGSVQWVDSEKCLRDGWPECCGETMWLDTSKVDGGPDATA